MLKFQEQFQIWILEVTRMSGPDKEFVWNSLITLLDHEWTKRLKEDKSLTDKDLEEIFQRMNIILLDRFPLVVRRMDYERLKRGNNELPSTFMERVFASSQFSFTKPTKQNLFVNQFNAINVRHTKLTTPQ